MAEIAGFLRDNVLAGATVSADSEAIGYPPIDVLDPRHDRPWRTAAGTAVLAFDCGASVTIGAFLLRVPSERDPALTPTPLIDPTDQVTIRASDISAGGSELLSETFSAGHHPRLGYIARVLRAGGSPTGALAPVSARYWEFEIASSSSFFEVENIFAGPIWTPAFNYNRGVTWSIDENAEIGRSSFTGGVFAEARSRLLEFAGSWDVWTAAELDQWEEFFLDCGITKPFVLLRQLSGDLSKRASISIFDAKPITTDRDGVHFFVRASFKEHR